MSDYYGIKIIDAIISGALYRVEDVSPLGGIMPDGSYQEAKVADHNHLTIWSSNAAEQLDSLARQFVRDGVLEERRKIHSYIRCLHGDVTRAYKEYRDDPACEPASTAYAQMLDLVETMMRELGVVNAKEVE